MEETQRRARDRATHDCAAQDGREDPAGHREPPPGPGRRGGVLPGDSRNLRRGVLPRPHQVPGGLPAAACHPLPPGPHQDPPTGGGPPASGRGRAGVHQGAHPGPPGVPAPANLPGRRPAGRRVGPPAGGAGSVEHTEQRPAAGSAAGAPLPRPLLVGAVSAQVPGAAPLAGPQSFLPVPDAAPQDGGDRHDSADGAGLPGTSEPPLAAGRHADQGHTPGHRRRLRSRGGHATPVAVVPQLPASTTSG